MAAAASSSAAPMACVGYGLLTAGDGTHWDSLMRPCTGRLELVMPARCTACVRGRAAKLSLRSVEVWVHCGLHYRPKRPAVPACTPPVPGKMPPATEIDTSFRFFPLWRDKPGSDLFFSVRAFRAGTCEELHGIGDRWVVELTLAASPDQPLRFCMAGKSDALAWQRELQMRAAPVATMWKRHKGLSGGGSAVGPSTPRDARASRLPAVAALADSMRLALPNDVLAGAAGIATARGED